jgi:2-oxoisovalerate dehydrogenase E1 component
LKPTLELPNGLSACTLAQGINRGLDAALRCAPEALLFGEDVAKKGGVYGVTRGLLADHGPARVFNTLLDEQTILGLALGSSSMGLLPIAEIQYLAYLHNAEDQLRGEAATLPFFSNSAFDNPMLLRIAGLAYQKGFGGHFHNDNSVAVLRDIPGLIVGVPARADDAWSMLDQALCLARDERRVVVLIEPIALYHQRDLYESGDGGWLATPQASPAALGRGRVYHTESADLLIVTYGNGLYLSLRARRTLELEHGISARVLDLRWLMPLPMADIERHLSQTGRALIVDECRKSGSPSEEIVALLHDRGLSGTIRRITAADCFVPLGSAARHVLVSEAEIVQAARDLVQS